MIVYLKWSVNTVHGWRGNCYWTLYSYRTMALIFFSLLDIRVNADTSRYKNGNYPHYSDIYSNCLLNWLQICGPLVAWIRSVLHCSSTPKWNLIHVWGSVHYNPMEPSRDQKSKYCCDYEVKSFQRPPSSSRCHLHKFIFFPVIPYFYFITCAIYVLLNV
jgi:hypothetical protein